MTPSRRALLAGFLAAPAAVKLLPDRVVVFAAERWGMAYTAAAEALDRMPGMRAFLSRLLP